MVYLVVTDGSKIVICVHRSDVTVAEWQCKSGETVTEVGEATFDALIGRNADYLFDPATGVITTKLTLAADKASIIADGVDTATITATIADSVNTDPVTFEMDGQTLAQVTPEGGEARLLMTFAPGNEGTKTVVATHPKYGRNEVRLEVVAGEA